MIWSGKRVAEYVEDVDEEMIQPNGVDLRVGECYILLPYTGKRKIVEPEDRYGYIPLKANRAYIVKFKNRVKIPEKTVGMFFVRSSMWRKRGILIQASLWDTGYVGHGEVLIFPTVNSFLYIGERFGQIVFADAEDTFLYNGQYQEDTLELNEKTKEELLQAEREIKEGHFKTHEEIVKVL